jgi:phosphate transport system substrate-binding protein
VADALTGGPDSPEEDPETTFSRQATAAGIVLPKRARRDPWTAVAIVVAVILVSAGIGEVTGWVNLRASSPGWSYQTESCSAAGVHAEGTYSAALGSSYGAWLDSVALAMAQTVGQCFRLDLNATPGDGYAPPLGGAGSEFAATYSAANASEWSALPNPEVTVPVSLNAVAVVYDLPSSDNGVNLSGPVLAGIFNGTIDSWSDPAIVALNPDLDLSGLPSILPMHDLDATSSTEAFTEFLSGSSPPWNSTVGSGATVNWPAGRGVASDSSMLPAVEATEGSIGYVELYAAPPTGVDIANVEDVAGNFASPTDVDTWIAANSLGNSSAVQSGDWLGFSLARAAAPWSYPLAALSYVGIYTDLGVAYGGAVTLTNASWLLGYVYWLTAEVSVAPLPTGFETAAVNALNNETYDGTKIMQLENEQTEGAEGGETGEF